ncbi:MAG: alcohol dehydrogenase catalytic domain-containing protein [Candidatus Binatia bacterium]
MRQLTFLEPGRFEWHDVPVPTLRAATDAIVRPLTVARCDLDLYIALGVVRYRGPFAFGHESVGEVVEAGDQVPFEPGDRVVVPFQLSCGRCPTCRRGLTSSCESFPFGAAYGLKPTSKTEFGGALSDRMYVPFADHMLLPLPAGVDPLVAASASDNIADGWRAVGPHLQERPGASVLVLGGLAQSVGIYAAGCAVALGAGKVLYLDDHPERRQRAAQLGATAEPLGLADGRTPDLQFDIVVESAGNADALAFAIRSTAANGMLTSNSIHLRETTPVPLTGAYYKGLTLNTSRVSSRAVLPHVLACLEAGALHPERVTHRVVPFADAADAMTDPGPKVVFTQDG